MLRLIDSRDQPPPHGHALHVATLKAGVGMLGDLQGGVLAVVLHEHVGGGPDIEVSGHDVAFL